MIANNFLLKVHQTVALLRLKPFDTSTDQGRSQERNRRAAWTSVTAAAAKIISISAALITIPLTVGYLGTERYGMWMTISSVIALLGIADLGVGSGVLNAIAHASGKNNRTGIRDSISSGFFVLSLLSLLIIGLFSALYALVPWPALFNVQSSTAAHEAGLVVGVLVCCFSANLPLGMVQQVQMGMQQGFIAHCWEAIGAMVGLIGVLVAIGMKVGLPWLALALAGAPVAMRAMNALVFFGRQCAWARPHRKGVRADAIKAVLGTGALFFALQMAGLVGYQSDHIVIAQLLGAEAVATYAVAMKLFSFPTMVVGLMLVPLWPAYGEAFARGDINWIKKTFRRSVWLGLVLNVPFTLVLVLWGGWIIEGWAGAAVVPSVGLLVGMGLWTLLTVFGGAFSVLLNGLHVVRFQVICATLMAVSNIVLSIFLVQKMGVAGAIYGSVLAIVIFTTIPYALYIPRLLRSISVKGEHVAS